jgi:hypothetical protein
MAERPTRFAALRSFLAGGDDQEEEGQNPAGKPGEEDEAEGEGEGEGESQEPGEGENQEPGEGEGEGEEGAGEAAPNQGNASAATLAERRRWASVLTSSAAEGRFEAACSMLVEDMGADAIIRVLGGLGKDNPAASRLASTPRHNLGAAPKGESGNDNSAAASRKKAVASRNAGIGRNTTTTNAKQRVAAGGSSKGE